MRKLKFGSEKNLLRQNGKTVVGVFLLNNKSDSAVNEKSDCCLIN